MKQKLLQSLFWLLQFTAVKYPFYRLLQFTQNLKVAETRSGIMYGSCKLYKKYVDGFPPFRPILSILQTPLYKPAKFLVSHLEPLTTTKYTVKD